MYAEPSAAPAPKAKLAERVPAPPEERERRGDREEKGSVQRDYGALAVETNTWALGVEARRERTEEHEAHGAAGERSVHETAKGEVNRRLPLRVHAELGRTGRHRAQ